MKCLARTLIVCEKPDAARRLADALTESRPALHRRYGLTYYEIEKQNDSLIICPALGHLYTVGSKEEGPRRRYPVWDYVWKPIHEVEKGQEYQQQWLKAIEELGKEADHFINACDFDIEGSLIGYMILKYACHAEEKAGRMKYSTLTKTDLNDAYLNVFPHLDYDIVKAGMCRHEIDWLYGINLSRALTESARKHSDQYTTISTGRVQGPTLNFIVEREIEVNNFKPIPYWTIGATVDVNGALVKAQYSKKTLETETEANHIVENVKGKSGNIDDFRETRMKVSPPYPFDLTTIQTEAHRHFHTSPSQTLRILENLYLQALISYPRTSSQKLPTSIDYRTIFNGINKFPEYKNLSSELIAGSKLNPVEGKKFDPAHPAIYPTGAMPKTGIEPRAKKFLDLVIKRFMTVFASEALRLNQKASFIVAKEYQFYINGSRIVEQGWFKYYHPYVKPTETIIPPVEKGTKVTVKEIFAQKHYTTPPPRFNPSSLIREMDKNEIGTKATRAGIIDILYKRGYIVDEAIRPTLLATKIIEVLNEHCPSIVDVSFTRELETQMNKIETGKTDHRTIVKNTVKELKIIFEKIASHEKEIGRELSEAISETKVQNYTLKIPCPNCGSQLRIIRSKKTKKRFIGCSGAMKGECRFSLPLMQFGTLKILDNYCKKCNFQLVSIKGKRRLPIVSCPKCYVEGLSNKRDS
ncbi:DNA topoisomerase I [[Eubacterium] cellulosolvens]